MKFKNISAYLVLHTRAYMRSRSAIFFQIAFPIILILLFGAIFAPTTYSPSNLVIQNDSPSAITWEIVDAINASGLFKVHVISQSVNLSHYISSNTVATALEIPGNFSSNLYSGHQGVLILKGEASPQVADSEYQLINGIITQINYRIGNTSQKLVLSSQIAIGSSDKTINYYVPGLIGFTVLTTMFNMVYTVPNFRKEKIFRQLSFTGISKSEWILSNVIHSFVMLIISDIILVVIGIYVFGASLALSPINILVTGVVLLTGLIFFTGIGILAGLISDNEETVAVIGNLILFPMMFISGVFFPLEFAPAYLVEISKFLPLTYFINSLISVMVYNNIPSVALQIVFLVISSIIVFVVAARLFSWKQR
jgi:ABC-2 type transport system permease protein